MLTLQDFEIEIAAGDGQAYPVSVLRSPSGQARSVLRLPSEHLPVSQWVVEVQDAVSSGQADVSALQSVGQALFEALFCDDVGRIYDLSQQTVRAQDEGLRIKLRINAPELTALPWELLYDAHQGEFVTLSRYTPLVRYLELPLPETDLAVQAPLRILGMIATPSDEFPLDVAREKGRFEQAIQDLRRRGLIELSWIEGQTWRDLQASLQQGPWHIFHFIGHATAAEHGDSSALLLADESGRSAPLTGNQLGRLVGAGCIGSLGLPAPQTALGSGPYDRAVSHCHRRVWPDRCLRQGQAIGTRPGAQSVAVRSTIRCV